MDIFSKDTLNLLKIINQNNFNNLNIKPIINNKFFMNLYYNLKKIYKKVIKDIDFKNIIKISPLKDKVESYLEDNKFTSKKITENIIKKLKYGHTINFENNTIIYFSELKTSSITQNIKDICIIIQTLKILFNHKDKSQHLTYFSLQEKKQFPFKNLGMIHLGPHECNSGLTYINLGHIIIFRQEECLKVLIHEMIHANHIDLHLRESKMNKKFCVNYDVLLNESFTETLANILNIFLINIRINGTKKNLELMYENEVKYSIYIYSKILDYYKITSVYDFVKNEKNICKTIFPQKTNVMAYYLLKNILLIKNKEFSEYIEKASSNKNDEKILSNMLEKIIFDNINLLDNNRLIIKKNDKNKSLRLTLYEI